MALTRPKVMVDPRDVVAARRRKNLSIIVSVVIWTMIAILAAVFNL